MVGIRRYDCAKLARPEPIKERFRVSTEANEARVLPMQVGDIEPRLLLPEVKAVFALDKITEI